MLGLLIKDLFNARKQAVWYVAMIVVFCILSAAIDNIAFCATIGILVTVSMPLTAVAYEEKDGWQKFIVASGTGIKTIVAEKYLLGILFALFSAAGYAIVFSLSGVQANQAAEFIAPVCMQFIALSVVLPIIFAFGVERGRVYMVVLIVIVMAALVGLMPILGDAIGGSRLIFTVSIACATVFLLIASFVISVKIYSKKEF